jgi:hypothetical protein
MLLWAPPSVTLLAATTVTVCGGDKKAGFVYESVNFWH